MTARPVTDERDPLPEKPWEPTSHEWARKAALDAAQAAVDAAKAKRGERNPAEGRRAVTGT